MRLVSMEVRPREENRKRHRAYVYRNLGNMEMYDSADRWFWESLLRFLAGRVIGKEGSSVWFQPSSPPGRTSRGESSGMGTHVASGPQAGAALNVRRRHRHLPTTQRWVRLSNHPQAKPGVPVVAKKSHRHGRGGGGGGARSGAPVIRIRVAAPLVLTALALTSP